jgi:hypothetical protein
MTHHDDNDATPPLDDLAHIYCRAGVHGDELARALESLGWGPNVPGSPARVGSPAELDALPVGSVIVDDEGDPWFAVDDDRPPRAGRWWVYNEPDSGVRRRSAYVVDLAPVVRFRPDASPVDVTPTPAELDDATVERAALAAARAGEVVEVGDAFAGEVVAVVQAAVKAAVRNIPGHVSDRAAEGIARAALHAFTPRLAVLLREAEARGAARGDATPGGTEWGVRHRSIRADMPPDSYGRGRGGEAMARRVAARNEGLLLLSREVTEWREVQP